MKKSILVLILFALTGMLLAQVGSSCQDPMVMTLPVVDYSDNTEAYGNNYSSVMVNPVSNYLNGYDFVAQFTIENESVVTASVSGSWTGLFIVNQEPTTDTPAEVIAVGSGSNGGNISDLTLSPGTYFAIVSTWPTPNFTDFVLNISATELTSDVLPAILVSPENEAINQDINLTLTWLADAAGAVPTSYLLNLGTDNPPTNIMNNVDLGDVTSYVVTEALDYSTTYYWSIVAVGTNTADASEIRMFTTMDNPIISEFPWTETFETYPPLNWTEGNGALTESTEINMGYSSWAEDGFANSGTTGAARVNIYGTSNDEWMFTCPIDLGDGSIDYQLEFDAALTDYNNSNAPESVGDDDLFMIYAFTDGIIDYAHANLIYSVEGQDLLNIPVEGTHIVNSLADYTGIVKFGFYTESTASNGDNDFFIDNVMVQEMSEGPVAYVAPLAVDFGIVNVGETSEAMNVTVSNVGGGSFTINEPVITGTDAAMFSITSDLTYPAEVNETPVVLSVAFAPTEEGAHEATLEITDSLGREVHTVTLSGMGFVMDENDTPDVATEVTVPVDSVLYQINPEGDVDWYKFEVSNLGDLTIFTERPEGALDAKAWLYGPCSADGSDISADTNVATDDDSNGNLQPLIEYTPEATGTYFLRIAHYNNAPVYDRSLLKKNTTRATTGVYALTIEQADVPESGAIAGTVTDADSGNPIEGAMITAGDYTATTDVDGMYMIEDVMAGNYDVECVMTGYTTQTINADVVSGETTTVDFAMTEVADEDMWPATNLQYSIFSQNNVHLTWDMAQDPSYIVLGYDDGSVESWWAVGDMVDGEAMAQPYTYAEAYNLEELRLYLKSDAGADQQVDVVLYADNGGMPGATELWSTSVDFNSTDPTWVNIPVEGISFDANTVFWIATNWTTGDDFRVGGDNDDPDGLIYYTMDGGTNWTNYAASDLMIHAVVTTQTGRSVEAQKVSYVKSPVSNRTSNVTLSSLGNHNSSKLRNIPQISNLTNKIKSSLRSFDRSLLGYNVYRNDELLNEEPVLNTEYSDLALANGTYTYYVKAVYDAGLSEASNSVEVTIESTVFYNEDFEDISEWTIVNDETHNGEYTWENTNAGGRDLVGSEGAFVSIDSDINGSGEVVTWSTLYSPIIDCSDKAGVTINFTHYYRHLGAQYGKVYVIVGEDVHQVAEYTESSENGEEVEINISEFADGMDNVQLAFEFNDAGGWNWYWLIDSLVLLEGQVMEYGTIAGTVTDADSGNPIEGAMITAGDYTAITDVDGMYSMTVLTGTYTVNCNHPDYDAVDPVEVTVTVDETSTVDFALTLTGDEILPIENLAVSEMTEEGALITWGSPVGSILLVDDDGSAYTDTFTDVVPYYTSVLDELGIEFDVYEIETAEADGPSAAELGNYDIVIWDCGEQWQNNQTLSVNDEANLASYLDNGGKLILSAHDYLWDRYSSAGAFSAGDFPYDYLGVASAAQDQFTVGESQNGPASVVINGAGYTDGLTVSLQDIFSTGTRDGVYLDYLVPNAMGSAYSTYEGNTVGIQTNNTIFTTAGLAGLIDDASTVADYFAASLGFGRSTRDFEGYRVELDGEEVVSGLFDNQYLLTGLTLNQTYTVTVTGVYTDGESDPASLTFTYTYDVGNHSDIDTPAVTALHNNYPNPFNPVTNILYSVAEESNVTIDVYNMRGQKVKSLVNGVVPAGNHTVTWNGDDENGKTVGSGVYFYKMKNGRYTSTKKMILLK